MFSENSRERWVIVVGVVGIFSLLVASLGYALRDSATWYDAGQINQFVLDQQSIESEAAH